MSWLQAFNQASLNMQTMNAIRNNNEWNKLNQERVQQEAFQRALANGEPDAMANYGYWLYTSGNKEQGYEYMAKAAIKGEAISLANFNWYKLKDGEHEDAIILYEATRNTLKRNVTPYGLANVDSNHILNQMADGRKVENAEKDWLLSAAKTGHLESKFYPILLAHKNKDLKKRDKLAESLTKGELKTMHDETLENQMSSKGWFKKWSNEAFKLVELLEKGK